MTRYFEMTRYVCGWPPGRGAQRGFTLIELAIVLVIVGLLIAGFVAGLRLYMVKVKMERTTSHIEEVRMALSEYVQNMNGPGPDGILGNADDVTDDEVRFPCPAGLTVAEGAAGYGAELAGCAALPEPAPGQIGSTGVWARTGRDDAGNSVGTVLVGGVPTGTLGLPGKYAYDGYGNRLVYAVTWDLTQNDALMADGGTRRPGRVGLTFPGDGDGDGTFAPGETDTTAVDFVVFSPGQGREGAFTAAGVLTRPCGAGADGANCAWMDAADGGSAGDAAFEDQRGWSLNTAAGAGVYYDDTLTSTLGAGSDTNDTWWGATETNSAVDIHNQANSDNVIIDGTANRSQLIVNHTGSNQVEVDNRGVGGPMVVAAGAEPDMTFERWAGAALQSRWYLGNPAGGDEDFLVRYTGGGDDRQVMRLGDHTDPGRVRIGTGTNVGTSGAFVGESFFQQQSKSAGMGYLEVPWIQTNGCIEGDGRGGETTALCLGGGGPGADAQGRNNGITRQDEISLRTQGLNRLFIRANGDTVLGHMAEGFDPGTQWGARLYFSGARDVSGTWNNDNSDPLFIGRYNVADDASELRVNIGDNLASPGDSLTIGASPGGTWTEVMRVRSDGNVGIGTAAPLANLHVHNATNQGGVFISGAGDGNYTYSALYMTDQNGDPRVNGWAFSHKKEVGTAGENDLHIGRGSSGTWRTDLAVDAGTGNVGIGTLTPAERLHVRGNIFAETWSDGTGGGITASSNLIANRDIIAGQNITAGVAVHAPHFYYNSP